MRNDEEKRPLWKRLQDSLRRLVGRRRSSDPPPADPYAYHMAPLRRGPKDRSGAAVAEIEDDSYRSFPPRH
jgi:hypothetical protein